MVTLYVHFSCFWALFHRRKKMQQLIPPAPYKSFDEDFLCFASTYDEEEKQELSIFVFHHKPTY